jgi:protein O-mannosyl-transferase
MGKDKKNKKDSKQSRPASGNKSDGNQPSSRLRNRFLGIILLATFLVYLPVFSPDKTFTNWDDPGYVTEQVLVKDFNSKRIKELFNPATHVMLNYHPLTMLSLALDYKLGYDKKTGKLSIRPFVISNLLFHLINAGLVFAFVLLLLDNKLWAATLAGLWFGIHPMHVESVAWISERKDVLYGFFFFAGLISYLIYLKQNKTKFLIFSFLLFTASCLSKAMATPFPVVLLLIDWFRGRKFTTRVWMEKIPFFLLSLLIGYNAVLIQSREAIADFEIFSLGQRFMFASYGFVMYVVKLFLPLGLSAFYPYPSLTESGNVPALFMLMPILAMALLAVPILIFKKNNTPLSRSLVFGSLFYFFMVALVLQFVSVGQAIMADRYSYIPYVGLFIPLGILLERYAKDQSRKTALGLFVCLSLVFAWISYKRIPVWNNSRDLWTDVIEKYPFEIEQAGNVVKVVKRGFETAYKNRGNWYADQQMYDSAFADYTVLSRAGTKDAGVWSNLGNVYALKNDFQNSLMAYSKAIEYNPKNLQTYLNRGLTYANMGRYAEAIDDMNLALGLDPGNEQAITIICRSLLNSGRFPETIESSTKNIELFPGNAELWFYRGTAYINTGNFPQGVSDIQKAITLNPNSGAYYYNLAFGYLRMGQKEKAREQAVLAQKAGFQVPVDFLKQLE